jgi:hypothetical protein
MTQKGYLKGFKESARYAGGVVSAGYKLWDFQMHQKNDLNDFIFGTKLR